MARPQDASDAVLCEKVRNGDSTAFRSLFDTYYGDLYRFFCYRGMEAQHAEDMAQDIFVRVWQNRTRLNPEASIRAYLFQAAANEIRMHYRKKKVRDAHADDVKKSAPVYTIPVSDFDQKAHIEKAIQSLPSAMQEVFVLHRFDGLSYKEIAHLKGVSVKTVESRMSKALKQLRAQLLHLVKLSLVFFYG